MVFWGEGIFSPRLFPVEDVIQRPVAVPLWSFTLKSQAELSKPQALHSAGNLATYRLTAKHDSDFDAGVGMLFSFYTGKILGMIVSSKKTTCRILSVGVLILLVLFWKPWKWKMHCRLPPAASFRPSITAAAIRWPKVMCWPWSVKGTAHGARHKVLGVKGKRLKVGGSQIRRAEVKKMRR